MSSGPETTVHESKQSDSRIHRDPRNIRRSMPGINAVWVESDLRQRRIPGHAGAGRPRNLCGGCRAASTPNLGGHHCWRSSRRCRGPHAGAHPQPACRPRNPGHQRGGITRRGYRSRVPRHTRHHRLRVVCPGGGHTSGHRRIPARRRGPGERDSRETHAGRCGDLHGNFRHGANRAVEQPGSL